MKLNVVLRTCDRTSITSKRIVPKDECVKRCLKSLVDSLQNYGGDYHLHIIDDNSSETTKEALKQIAPKATINFLPHREDGLTPLQKSRYSVKVAYDYIYQLPLNELVYIVEDDYLHYSNSISIMVESWMYFSSLDRNIRIGIFPQDYNQLYFHPNHPFNNVYVKPCMVIPGPDRYFRTTWYTHESFMIDVETIRKYRTEFEKLLEIGTVEQAWEGSSLSNVWMKDDVKMMMPLGTLAIHLSQDYDISFYTDWQKVWKNNEIKENIE